MINDEDIKSKLLILFILEKLDVGKQYIRIELILPEALGSGPSGGNVLVPARTLRRSRLKGRCRKAAPLYEFLIKRLKAFY